MKVKSGSGQNSPKMRIFSLAKIKSGSELRVEEAEEFSTRNINDNNTNNNTFDFRVFFCKHNNPVIALLFCS